MKRFLSYVIFFVIASTVWSQDLSFGNGVFIESDFGGGFKNEISAEKIFGDRDVIVGMPMHYFGGGGFVFFDATYTVASFGFSVGGGIWEGTEMTLDYDLNDPLLKKTNKTMDFSFTSLNLA